MEKQAFYFGYAGSGGHFLRGTDLRALYSRAPAGFPWTDALMDTGLLTNGKIPDRPDGVVHWTCGGRDMLWFAFFWWDRSGDSRGNSNSGFYVSGLKLDDRAAAFEYACAQFPQIVARQKFPLRLSSV